MVSSQVITECLESERIKMGAVVWSIVKDYHATEDILQDVLLKALAKQCEFENEKSVIAWSYVVAKNAAISLCRKSSNRRNLLNHIALDSLAKGQEHFSSEFHDKMEALNFCLKKLPEKIKGIMVSRYYNGESIKGISKKKGLSTDAVYQTISRTHRKLRDCIKNNLPTSS